MKLCGLVRAGVDDVDEAEIEVNAIERTTGANGCAGLFVIARMCAELSKLSCALLRPIRHQNGPEATTTTTAADLLRKQTETICIANVLDEGM